MRPESTRRGVALLAALVVLGIVGTLLIAGYFAEREQWAARLVAGRSAQLRAAVEGAVIDAMAQWDSAVQFRQPPGGTARLPGPWNGTEWPVTGNVTRLSTWVYRMAVRATDEVDSSLVASSARLLIVDAPRFASPGVLIARGDVSANGSLAVEGADPAAAEKCEAPPGWGDRIVTAPGWIAPADALVDAGAADDSTYSEFGGVTRDELQARADRSLPGGSVVAAPVGNVIHAAGDLELTGGTGAGLLLIDGALRVSGSAVFRGVIVISGGLTVTRGRFELIGLL
ncbi:MAG: hypothetical protein ACREN3_10205, partial [Gemmatimonadaceae bacterium]